jgi:hypothetical protein
MGLITDSGSSIMATVLTRSDGSVDVVLTNAGKRLKSNAQAHPVWGSIALLKSGVWIWNHRGAGEGERAFSTTFKP